MDESVFDRLIISKPGDPYKDINPLLSDKDAFKYSVDCLIEKLKPLLEGHNVTKIVCPAGDTTFASALAYTLGLGVIILNPYDGFAPHMQWRPETKFEAKGKEKEHEVRELWVEKK